MAKRHYRTAKKAVVKNQGTVIPKENEKQVAGIAGGILALTFIVGLLLGKLSK